MDELAGYRVLRAAGRGSRTRLVLGYDEGDTVVLKVAAVDDGRAFVELEALERAAGEHVVSLLDVAADEQRTVLVLERLPRGTLAELLEIRGALTAGEAVTILAPVAATLTRMHAAGVAHGALSLATIGFRDDGAPTLLALGAAELFAPGAPEVVREQVAGVAADRAALRDVTALVLGRVTGPGSAAAHRLAVDVSTLSPEGLGAALFTLASPEAVRFDSGASDLGVRVGAVNPDAAPEPPPRPSVLPVGIVALVPDSVRGPVVGVAERCVAMWSAWSTGRRRLVLGGGAAALTVVVALTATPAGSTAPVVAAPVAVESPSSPAEDVDDGLSHDPLEAALALLQRREGCLRDLSALCLETVVQAGSAAEADDVALVRSVLAGDELPAAQIVDGDPVLVERLGGSALIDLPAGSRPSSILLLETENGWRIRSYLDAPAVEAG